jgi:hypothetical protein
LQDLLQNAAMEEIAPGVMHWQAPHPRIGVDVSSYWLPRLRTLLDPLAVPDEVEGVQHILLSCRHHLRDSLEVRTRFGAVVRAPRTGMHEFDEDTPIVPDDYMDEPEETKAGLKSAFAQLADELDFDVLLLAHGNPIPSGGREALRRFASS